jgi:AraC-like DNA-binding protein
MLLYFPHNNRYWLPADGKWSFFYLCLHGSNVVHCWQRLVSSVGPVVDFRPNPGLIDAAAGLCGRILDSTITSPWQASSEAYAFTMQLMNECFPQPLQGTHSRSLPEPMRKVVDSIGRNLRHSPNIDTLAAAAGQSRFHFSRQFKKHLGMPPGEYVLREKLKAVVELLNTSDLPLADIAPLCGFSDPNYLIRVFKKLYGITPLQFRRRR